MKLIITIENKSPRKLKQLRDWLNDALDTWAKDKELPMKGTEWQAEVKK
jgi:hypothetical protein